MPCSREQVAQHAAERVGAGGTHAGDARAELREDDGRAAGGAGGRHPDLLDELTLGAVRDGLDVADVHVEDVDPEGDDDGRERVWGGGHDASWAGRVVP